MNQVSADSPKVTLPHARKGTSPLIPTLVAAGVWVLIAMWDLRLAFSVLAAVAAAIFVVRTVQRPVLGLVVMIPAAALDVTGRVAQVSGVIITLYQLVVLLTLVAVIAAFVRGSLKPVSSPMDLPVLAFLALALTAIPAAGNPQLAMVSAASLVSSGIALFLTVWVIRDIESAWLVLLVFALVAAVLGVLAVLEREHIFALRGVYFQVWQDGIRARVTFQDPNILGAFLVPASLLAMSWAVGERDRGRRWLMIGSCVAATAGMFATLSRGAVGGWLVGVLVVIAFSTLSLRWKVGIVLAVGGALFLVATVVLGPAWIQAKIVGVGGNASAMYRIYMARAALQISRDYPMGVGPGNYPLIFPLYRDAFVKTGLVESHTAYLTILVEMGILGLAAFLWLLWRYFSRTATAVWRATDPRVHALAVGALAAGTALAAQAFTYSLESTKILWFTFGLGMVAYRLATGSAEAQASKGAVGD
jgi:O-antigen ligase